VFPTPEAERLTLLFAGPGREPLATLAELDREIAGALAPALDHGVAHAKLAWWRQEAERAAAGRAAHPLTRRLAASHGGAHWPALAERVSAAERALAGLRPALAEDLEREARLSHGALWSLGCELLVPSHAPAAREYGAVLGTAIGLAAGQRSDAPRADALSLAHQRLEAAHALQAREPQAAPVAARVVAALTRATLAGTAHPLMQLWIAWRTARKALKELEA